MAVPTIPPPLYFGLFLVALGSVLSSEVLHVRRLEQYRTTVGYSPVSFYTLVITRSLRGLRATPPPLIIGFPIALVAALLAFFLLPPYQSVFAIGVVLALWLILLVIGRLLRW
ncbi:MAG: hypothetical protein J2P57_02410 [Acidimicrobiaceae bacterium]|nr:hypothetical protein [Acidimicrobiaceae bacterium]